jgi:hypothetical protein
MTSKEKRLRGKVVEIEPTDNTKVINGEEWRRVIFTLGELQFSKRVKEDIPESLKDRKVKLVRYTLYDWHNLVGVKKTFTVEETVAVLNSKPKETVFW